MASKTNDDTLSVVDGVVRYSRSAGAVWEFSVRDLRMVAERTNDQGPWQDDYFYIFVAGAPPSFYEAPVYANPHLLRELASVIGSETFSLLAHSTEWDSR